MRIIVAFPSHIRLWLGQSLDPFVYSNALVFVQIAIAFVLDLKQDRRQPLVQIAQSHLKIPHKAEK